MVAVEQYNDLYIKTTGERLDSIVGESAREIIDKLQWHLDYSNGILFRQNIRQSTSDVQDNIQGFLRGEMAERLSAFLPLSDCSTIYTSVDTGQFTSVSLNDLFGVSTKSDILRKAAEISFRENPPGYIIDEIQNDSLGTDKKSALGDEMIEELVAGYALSGGLLYDRTVIPDGALVDLNGELVGFVEVKAYKPRSAEGIERGIRLSQEIEFIDILRQLAFNRHSLKERMPVLLRFPEDASNPALQQYGRRVAGSGYRNIMIQKLPLTSDALTIKAMEFVRDHMEDMRTYVSPHKRYFRYKEISAMENIAYGNYQF